MTYVRLVLAILLLPNFLCAESFTATVTEVNASAASNLEQTCFYYCLCKNASSCTCQDWIPARSATGAYCINSDNNQGSDNIQHTWNVKLYTGDMPVTMRYTATSVTTGGNESTRGAVVNSYTFSQ